MYKQSGKKSMSGFLAKKVLNHKLEIIEINKSVIDFVMLLSQFFAQFRGIKNNYNQLFAALVKNLGEGKARFMMKILDKSTLDFNGLFKDSPERNIERTAINKSQSETNRPGQFTESYGVPQSADSDSSNISIGLFRTA
ncbi:hypothetical protein D0T84_19510 [Dysgonomonas sp. 521]|uniref:plasmid mobilization protein n=1 Tax=Dysgonomonas sp. 521 TaxID=2302932 RepID=UPI0013D85104|nr:hypothetical protein [Dysgonomonas sp. 521]NDV97075.1 hypothetical protein [Dysgonomonas sp. 521]